MATCISSRTSPARRPPVGGGGRRRRPSGSKGRLHPRQALSERTCERERGAADRDRRLRGASRPN
eukprot:13010160-Alexandrium_andersonii.AAC.1